MSIIDTHGVANSWLGGIRTGQSQLALREQLAQEAADREYRDRVLGIRQQEYQREADREAAQREADRALATQQFDLFSALNGGIGQYAGMQPGQQQQQTQGPQAYGPPAPDQMQAMAGPVQPQMGGMGGAGGGMGGMNRDMFASASPQARQQFVQQVGQLSQQRRVNEELARKQALAPNYEAIIRDKFTGEERNHALGLLDMFVNTEMTPKQFEDELRQIESEAGARQYAMQRYGEQFPEPQTTGTEADFFAQSPQQYQQGMQAFASMDPMRQASEYGRWDRDAQSADRLAQQKELAMLKASARKGGAVVPYESTDEMLATFPNLAPVAGDMLTRYNAGAITFNDLQQENNRRGKPRGNSERQAIMDRMRLEADQVELFGKMMESDPEQAEKYRANQNAAIQRLRQVQDELRAYSATATQASSPRPGGDAFGSPLGSSSGSDANEDEDAYISRRLDEGATEDQIVAELAARKRPQG
jgi:hypothetical protein